MASIELDNVEDAVEEIVSGVESASSGGTWSVLGEPTAGKSAVLERLYDYFKDEGSVRPILVTPPPRAYDAAHAALIELAEGLELNQTALAAIQDPETAWSSKLQRIGNALRREGRVVLLLDEPDLWSPRETYFTEFVQDIWNLVFAPVGLTTVTAGPTPFLVRGHHAIHLDPASNPEAVLAAIEAPALRAAKDAVAFRFQTSLPSVSPLQVRLLVAIAALSEPELDRVDATAFDHRAALVEVLANLADAETPALRDLWLHLAAVREPFDQELLGLLGLHELAARDAAIIDECLLFARRGGLVLHESLRTITRQIDHDTHGIHGLLAKYYRHRFTAPDVGVKTRLRDSIEAFHHASSAGIFDLDTYRPFFVDQLNILGYQLSVDERNLGSAAEAFQVALSWDPTNAYAAHYRAFNLDRQAGTPGASVDPDEVERLYRLAVERQSQHPWFRARLINFLIAQSRIDDAWSAWLDASEAFGSEPAENIYFGLHLHVARNLLYRGELRHTHALLRGLPTEIANDGRFRAIQERLWALREAEEHGSYVPATYLKPDWWKYPKRLASTGLQRWLAAKVASVTADTVELDVADITPGARPEYGYLELQLKTLAEWWKEPADLSSLQAGEFIEIGFYGRDGEQAVALRHPRVRWEDLTLPEDDPDRYLRVAM
jgi:hypothetical protein